MRIRITSPGIYGADGEVPVGTEFDINGEPPAGWKGRYDVVSSAPKDGSVALTNGEPGPLDGSVEDLEKHLEGVTDPDEVQKLIDAETGGKSRKGALAALEARRDALLEA